MPRLVPYPHGADLTLELSERQQHVKHQLTHAGFGVERLGNTDERGVGLLELLDDPREVGETASQPVDLVDDDDVDLARLHVLEQGLQGRPFHRPTRDAAVVVTLAVKAPALVALAGNVSLARVVLGVEAVELLLQPLFARLARVDGTANPAHTISPKNFGPDQRVPVILLAMPDNELNRSPSKTSPLSLTSTT